ncbi:MAG: PEP-CTERM sorting domain-containing protein [Acetobacteraceae bacterium]
MRGALVAAAASLAVLAVPGTASALPVPNGSFGFTTVGGTITATGSSQIGNGTTSLTLPNTLSINSILPIFLGNPNNLGFSLLDAVGLSPLTLAVSPGTGFHSTLETVTIDSDTFVFTQLKTTSGSAGHLGLTWVGQITAAPGLAVPQSADMTAAFTQASAGASIGGTFSISTPSVIHTTPEPMSVAILGMGLLGLGLIRRKHG